MSGGLYSTEGRDCDQTLDLKKIKPYGDTMNDGKTQLSFTLPVPAGDEAIEAAKQLMKKMGFENPQVVFHRELTAGTRSSTATEAAPIRSIIRISMSRKSNRPNGTWPKRTASSASRSAARSW